MMTSPPTAPACACWKDCWAPAEPGTRLCRQCRLAEHLVRQCGDCSHDAHDGAVCIVIVDRHSASQGDGEGECMCDASTEDYRRWSLS